MRHRVSHANSFELVSMNSEIFIDHHDYKNVVGRSVKLHNRVSENFVIWFIHTVLSSHVDPEPVRAIINPSFLSRPPESKAVRSTAIK